MDLVDMQQLAPFNCGTKYFLAVTETFTKYDFVRGLTDKTGLNVLNELMKLVKNLSQ
jgi:hypothetical protein